MKKIYEGEAPNQYTDEDPMLMKIANEDWIYKDSNYAEHGKHPISVTLNKYLNSRLAYHKAEPQEAMVLFDLLEAEVKPNGENFGISLRKIINAARVILEGKAVLMMDDDALNVPEVPTLIDDVFNELKESTILSVVNDFENLLYFDEVIVFNEGFIVERGDPKKLLVDKSSKLFSTIKIVDKALARVLEEKIDMLLSQKKILTEFNCFKIPSWFKKSGYHVPMFE